MERYDPARVADDLVDCRQRGLDWLDRKTSNQSPIRAEALTQLAAQYAGARGNVPTGRVAQIKVLLRDGIAELSRQGHTGDAGLLRDLFFGDAADGPIKPPGELLKVAREKSGDSTEARFRERRTNTIRSFAQFLIVFVSPASSQPRIAAHNDVSGQHTRTAVVGYVGDNGHFIRLLSEAVNVTIVGITNERLTPMLQEALRRKRANGGPEAFWGSLRIVFLGRELLGAVDDEREEFPDSRQALRQRTQEATWARRSIGALLKRTKSTRWEVLECHYMPAITGAMFDFGDRKVVHILMRRPRRPTGDHMYIDLDESADQYFSALFEDIVRNSVSGSMIVPAGVPVGDSFLCTESRPRYKVLREGSGTDGWLPMVLVVMTRPRGSHVGAMLQLRTEDNSARELYRLSHVSGHVIRQDLALQPGRTLGDTPQRLHLEHEIPLRAAQRVVAEVTGIDPPSLLRPVTSSSYLHADMEHLFFYIYALELPEGTQFPRRAEMHSYPLAELISVRANQVLRSAQRLCGKASSVSERKWADAAGIVALNLQLHGYAELAQRMLELAPRRDSEVAGMVAAIRQLVTERTSPSWISATREVQVLGLAGWQYREFFSVLLPLYADIGIDGASDLCASLAGDATKNAAVTRLSEIYQDEHLIASMPIEL